MNNHLSEEQFARCFVGLATGEEQQHVIECAECSSELDGFDNSVSSLRHAIRGRVDAQAEPQTATAMPLAIQPSTTAGKKIRWAVAAAAVLLLGLIPVLTIKKPQAITVTRGIPPSPDALMDAINIHLSRTVPAPMEPMMSLIPSEESSTE